MAQVEGMFADNITVSSSVTNGRSQTSSTASAPAEGKATGSFLFPLNISTYISSDYGWRVLNGENNFHGGIDLPAGKGTPIYAADGGVVETKEYHYSWGNHVRIDHGNGLMTNYAHMDSIATSYGAKVKQGDLIGYVGDTGNAYGDHLHLEVWRGGDRVDPKPYFNLQAGATRGYDGSGSGTGTYSGSGSGTYSGSGNTSPEASAASSASGTKKKTNVEITTVRLIASHGSLTQKAGSVIADEESETECFLLIQRGDVIYKPYLTGDIKVTRERAGSPGKMTFACVQVEGMSIEEGDAVAFRYKNEKVFFGYVFAVKLTSDKKQINVTCYDQLRYFKNKDTFTYSLTYSELLTQICAKYGYKTGDIEKTTYKMPQRIAEGTLFDILREVSDETTLYKGEYYVLYDDFGEICLKSIMNMLLSTLVDGETSGSWEFTSDIDGDTYNRIMLARDNDSTGVRELFIANDPETQSKWGALAFYESLDASDADIKARAKAYLDYYNTPKKTLTLKNCIGNTNVRGGSGIVCDIDPGNGETVTRLLIVDKVEHKFSESNHTMDLKLIGGGFVA